jgi:hypothetical protein
VGSFSDNQTKELEKNGDFDQVTATWSEKIDLNIVFFMKNADFFRRKMAKIVENSDQNINLW